MYTYLINGCRYVEGLQSEMLAVVYYFLVAPRDYEFNTNIHRKLEKKQKYVL